MNRLLVPIYPLPEPHMLWEDLKLELGSASFQKLKNELERRKCKTLLAGPLAKDVEDILDRL